MSKLRLVGSLVIALAVVVGIGWWGIRTFGLRVPAGTTLAANVPPTPRQDLGNVYAVGGVVNAPIPIYKPEPPYTPEARAAKLQGTFVSSVVIDDRGNVKDVQVKRSLDQGLDESAMQTMRTWKFKPATKDGKPVPVRVTVEVSFRLF